MVEFIKIFSLIDLLIILTCGTVFACLTLYKQLNKEFTPKDNFESDEYYEQNINEIEDLYDEGYVNEVNEYEDRISELRNKLKTPIDLHINPIEIITDEYEKSLE